jgi:uncharacterized protein (TIGR00288 family)
VTDKHDYAPNIAIFCDFENVALGAKDANFEAFDIHLVLERLLDKGKIVVKKAYANWEHYKTARRPLHESGFELFEIPHVSYSGKNSADIRMVVDALDLCYTKSHVELFVIISGDSDFSPLVGKLRENDKTVIGMGVKNSTSDLLVESCDEFIYYDDLVQDRAKGSRKSTIIRDNPAERAKDKVKDRDKDKGESKAVPAAPAAQSAEPSSKKRGTAEVEGGPEDLHRKQEALEMVLDTVDRLFRERDDNVWGSMVKQTLKRKRPNFAETFHGYRSFNQLLEDAQKRGLLEIQKDDKSGGYIIVGFGPKA